MINVPFRKGGLLFVGLAVSIVASATTHLQDSLKRGSGVSLRTNLLWDAAAEPNLGVEFPVGKHVSLGVNA